MVLMASASYVILPAGGNAQKSGKILRGDQVLAVGDVDVSSASLDAVMETVGKAASSVRIQMGRSVRVPAGQGNTLLVGSTFAPCFAALVSIVCVSMSCCRSVWST